MKGNGTGWAESLRLGKALRCAFSREVHEEAGLVIHDPQLAWAAYLRKFQGERLVCFCLYGNRI